MYLRYVVVHKTAVTVHSAASLNTALTYFPRIFLLISSVFQKKINLISNGILLFYQANFCAPFVVPLPRWTDEAFNYKDMRLKVFTEVSIKISFLRNVTSCVLVDKYTFQRNVKKIKNEVADSWEI
jgi:hypothetical protein